MIWISFVFYFSFLGGRDVGVWQWHGLVSACSLWGKGDVIMVTVPLVASAGRVYLCSAACAGFSAEECMFRLLERLATRLARILLVRSGFRSLPFDFVGSCPCFVRFVSLQRGACERHPPVPLYVTSCSDTLRKQYLTGGGESNYHTSTRRTREQVGPIDTHSANQIKQFLFCTQWYACRTIR